MSDDSKKNQKKISKKLSVDEIDFWDLDGDDDEESSSVSPTPRTPPPSQDLPKAEVPKRSSSQVKHIGARKGSRNGSKTSAKLGALPSSDQEKDSKPKRVKTRVIGGKRPESEETSSFAPNSRIEPANVAKPLLGSTSKEISPLLTDKLPMEELEDLDFIDDDEIATKRVEPTASEKPTLPEPSKEIDEPAAFADDPEELKTRESEAEADAGEPVGHSNKRRAPTKAEILLITAVATIALAAVFFGVFKSSTSLTSPQGWVDEPRVPLVGKSIALDSIETYWRPPSFTGASPDRADRDALYLPVIRFSVAEDSAAGQLRFLFVEADGEENTIHGDSKTIRVEPGQTYTIHGSTGFLEHSDLHAYRLREGNQWFTILREAPLGSATSGAFSELAQIPVSPTVYDSRQD